MNEDCNYSTELERCGRKNGTLVHELLKRKGLLLPSGQKEHPLQVTWIEGGSALDSVALTATVALLEEENADDRGEEVDDRQDEADTLADRVARDGTASSEVGVVADLKGRKRESGLVNSRRRLGTPTRVLAGLGV